MNINFPMYSAVPLKRGQFFHKYSQKTPQNSPVRIKHLIDILPQFLKLFMQYHTISYYFAPGYSGTPLCVVINC